MADGYWARQPNPYSSAPISKRPRPAFDARPTGASSGQENYPNLPQDDNHAGFHSLKDTKAIEESYERYLQKAQRPSSGYGEFNNFSDTGGGRGVGGGMPDPVGRMHNLPYGDPIMTGGPGPRSDMISNSPRFAFGGERTMDSMVRQGPPGLEMPLPPDASSTLFVEGLPRDISEREVAHIFRPFLGYKEVRVVTKEPKFHSAERMLLCFVDFTDATCAMRACKALQGYKLDEKDPDAAALRLQFSRSGPRTIHTSRGRR